MNKKEVWWFGRSALGLSFYLIDARVMSEKYCDISNFRKVHSKHKKKKKHVWGIYPVWLEKWLYIWLKWIIHDAPTCAIHILLHIRKYLHNITLICAEMVPITILKSFHSCTVRSAKTSSTFSLTTDWKKNLDIWKPLHDAFGGKGARRTSINGTWWSTNLCSYHFSMPQYIV